MSCKIGVLVSGNGSNLQAIIEALKNKPVAEIVCVISSKPNVYALERAAQNNIKTATVIRKGVPLDVYESSLLQILEEHGVDLVLLAGYTVVHSKGFVQRYKNRIMNIHPSLIPSFCGHGFYGLRVHEAVIESGVKLTGATVHFVDEGTDTGPIVLQKTVPVMDEDTPVTLQQRVLNEAETVIYPQAVILFAQGRLVIENNRVYVKG